jgi:hypothetical protein
MLGELAKQILFQTRSIPEEVWAMFQKHTSITVEKAKQILTQLLSGFDQIYICIDSVDECQPQFREELLCFLATLKGTGIHIFCTGRSHIVTEVTAFLGPFNIKSMEICAQEADIRLYINEKISLDRHKGAMDEQLQEQITTKLVSHKL